MIKWASLFSSDVSRGSANKETKRQEEDKEDVKVAEGSMLNMSLKGRHLLLISTSFHFTRKI